MSWQQLFRKNNPATFRGVPFKIDAVDFSFGWKIDDVTPPPANQGGTTQAAIDEVRSLLRPETQTTSQQTKLLPTQFRVQAFFSGLNYVEEKKAFIAELQKNEEGQLILPTFEPMTVRVASVVNRFTNKEGGYETFQIAFVEAGSTVQPSSLLDTEGEASDAIDDSTFIERFSTKLSSGAQWVADASTDLTQKFSTNLLDTLGLGAAGDALDTVTASAQTISQNATTLIYTPETLANQISDTVEALTNAFRQPLNAFNAQKQLFEQYGLGLPGVSGATATERDARDNQNAFTQLVKNSAVAEMGRAAVLSDYATIEDALLIKAQFEAAARAQQLDNGNIEGQEQSYYDLANIIAAVSAHITSQENLPSANDVTYPDTNVAVPLAHDLYGEAGRGEEIVTRNAARHPLFLPTELNVLSF